MRRLPLEYAVRNLGRSPARTAAGVLGGLLVVLLVLAAAGFMRGMQRSLSFSGGERNVILLGAGSEESVERSQVAPNAAGLVAAGVPGIRTRLGVEYVSPEVHTALVLRAARDSSVELRALVRGVTPAAFLVHPQVRIVAGRMPRAGAYELLAGRLAATRLGVPRSALAIGQTLWFDQREWTICGEFAAPQTVLEAELWTPLTDLQLATRRDSLSCVVVTLADATPQDVAVWCAQRLDLELVALRETDYYATLLAFYAPVRAMIVATAALIALGGLLGGLNVMYAAFVARVRELGTLQTIGYSRSALLLSLLQESLLVAAAGGLGAAIIALFLLDGLGVRFSMGAFTLVIDAPVLFTGLAAGAALAVLGVLPPFWRCLRLPIAQALRTG